MCTTYIVSAYTIQQQQLKIIIIGIIRNVIGRYCIVFTNISLTNSLIMQFRKYLVYCQLNFINPCLEITKKNNIEDTVSRDYFQTRYVICICFSEFTFSTIFNNYLSSIIIRQNGKLGEFTVLQYYFGVHRNFSSSLSSI